MKKLERPILAEGDVLDRGVEVYEIEGGLRTFSSSSLVEIKHEEHGVVEILAGEYVSGVVKEYNHFREESRNVKD